MMMTYDMLDMAPQGRGEEHDAYGMQWVRHHDRYGSPAPAPGLVLLRLGRLTRRRA